MGAVLEQVFGLPGHGRLAWQSVTNQDLPVYHRHVLVASPLPSSTRACGWPAH